MPRYQPPPLDRFIKIRNPSDRPASVPDALGTTPTPEWGVDVWANRRDRGPYTLQEEGIQIPVGTTVWTIHARDDIAPDAEVVYLGSVYRLVGDPVERGGANARMAQLYFELHTTVRR